jgi:glyoxylase-like metal-dependent hydrolase (beta-lactamase superfamily II)
MNARISRNLLSHLAIAATTTLAAAAAQAKPLIVTVFTSDVPGFHATSTIVAGETSAVLIDSQLTLSAAHRLTAQLLESGKELKAVYVTHAHPDHYFGYEVVRSAFPDAKLYAPKAVADQMRTMGPEKVAEWKPMYGRNLTATPATPEVLDGDAITLEGETISVVALAPGEIDHAVAYFVPSASALIAGDAVYNGVHVWLAEADASHRQSWLGNLERLKALKAKVVVAGHKAPGRADTPAAIDATAAYIKAFDAEAKKAKDAAALQKAMLVRYKGLALPIILELAAKAEKGRRPSE